MKPIVIDLMDLVERHGAFRALVYKQVRNPNSSNHIVDVSVQLYCCTKPHDGMRQYMRSILIAQGAVIDESRYIAHQVAKRLER